MFYCVHGFAIYKCPYFPNILSPHASKIICIKKKVYVLLINEEELTIERYC